MNELEGIFAAYIAGRAGEGMIILAFRNQTITGIDLMGVRLDGSYILDGNVYKVKAKVTAPPNVPTIHGTNTGPQGTEYNVAFDIPHDFGSKPYFSLETPLGPVNARLSFLRDLGALQ